MPKDSETLDINRIRMVVFDIDGTLADTADLVATGQRRKPDDFLKLHGPSDVDSYETRFTYLRRLTSNLNRCGIRVAVISNAPKAYAGTVCYLLGVEADAIIASNNQHNLRTKTDRLRWLASEPKWQYFQPSPTIDVSDILYVGDLPEDMTAATEAGCKYQQIESYFEDLEAETPLARLEALCESIVAGVISPNERDSLWQHKRFEARKSHQQDVIENLTCRNFTIDMNLPELMLDPDALPGPINPFEPNSPVQNPLLDPSFVTREEYRHDQDLKSELLMAIATEHSAHSQNFSASHPQLSRTKIYAHLKYWDSHLGQDLWKNIKHWENMESGPEVNLLHLEFIALLMAASIWSHHDLRDPNMPRPVIVPIPSSPYNARHPARASNRLARRISQLTELQYKEVLEKKDGQIQIIDENSSSLDSVILIDDQLTKGGSAEKCLLKLCDLAKTVELRVWTSKHFKEEVRSESWLSDESRTPIQRTPNLGQRVHLGRFGLGRIIRINDEFMVVDFNSLGIHQFELNIPEIEFLD